MKRRCEYRAREALKNIVPPVEILYYNAASILCHASIPISVSSIFHLNSLGHRRRAFHGLCDNFGD